MNIDRVMNENCAVTPKQKWKDWTIYIPRLCTDSLQFMSYSLELDVLFKLQIWETNNKE